jgi:hypothetical protein
MLLPAIKLKTKTWERVKRCADAAGYSSPQEFVEHVLEKELDRLDEASSDEALVEKLRGLGYID